MTLPTAARHAAFLIALTLAAACADPSSGSPRLGPHDGLELPPVEPARVAVGDTAPDFTLRAHRRGPITLSEYRGERDVVLVFYRGHW